MKTFTASSNTTACARNSRQVIAHKRLRKVDWGCTLRCISRTG